MLPRLVPSVALILGLLALPADAADDPPSAAAPSQTANASQSESASAAAPAAAPVVQPGDAGFSRELAERLAAVSGTPSAADREDRAALTAFYAARQHAPVWVGATGLTPAGDAIVAEIRRADDWGLEASAFPLQAVTSAVGSDRARADAEIAVSHAVLKYARLARGSRSDPVTLSKFLDRKLPLLEPRQVIEAAAKADNPDAFLRFLHPQHPQFEALRQKYLALKRGQPVAAAPAPAAPPSADKKGSVAPKGAAVPASPSARKLLVNMEEWRWMPVSLGDFYVWVNVPEFTLRVVKNGQVVHTERVVAGKPDTPTPIFSQNMEQVIFHPNWGVPESIKKADVLPSLIRGSTRIFTFYHLKIQRGGRDVDPSTVDWSTADIRQFHVYQPPGENNVLGNIKFRFPNKHDVYMHDTPQKQLFNADLRAFSHGCMRVRNPQRLAELLLAEDQGWPAQRTAAAFAPGAPQNNQVNLGRKIPVHITYFTAAVSDDGKLKLFPDVYNHESKIALGMEGKAHLIPKEKALVSAEPGLAESRGPGYAKKDLVHQVFGNN
jgi:L,D-transpeptidase YcbB